MRGMRFGYWLCKSVALDTLRVVGGVTIIDRKKVPLTGPLWVISNHQSNFDPPIVGGTIHREVHFAAKKSLFKGFLGWIITYLNAIPVNRTGFDKDVIRKLTEVVKAGGCSVIFPEGTRSQDGTFLPIKGGIGMLFDLAPAPVLPIRVEGSWRLDKKQYRKEPIRVYVGDTIPVENIMKAAEGAADRKQVIADFLFDHVKRMGNGNTIRAAETTST